MAAAAVEVWPENMPIIAVFSGMQTQWRMGANGPVGLDYSVLPLVMRAMSVSRADLPDIFDGLRTMEYAALDEIHKG